VTEADWFLTRDERGNPSTSIDRGGDPGLAWTTGNAVTPLLHGRSYFSRLAEELRTVGSGDAVWILDWRGDADERLDGTTLGELLVDAIRRGADVRGLVWRSHPDEEKFSEQENAHLAEVVNRAGGEISLDERVRRFGSHHQKLVVIHRADHDASVAFVGGIDLGHGRNDDERHRGDPQRIEIDARYGSTPAWHDAQLEVRGPAVGDLARTFRERWEDPTPLDHRNPFRDTIRHLVREPRRVQPLPAETAAPAKAGDVAVQVLRTYPKKRPSFPFAPNGERSIARAYIKALRRARSFVYIEDQYLWSTEVAGVLAAALHRVRDLRVIAVVPRYPDRDGHVSGPLQRIGQVEAVELVRRAGGERVGLSDRTTSTFGPGRTTPSSRVRYWIPRWMSEGLAIPRTAAMERGAFPGTSGFGCGESTWVTRYPKSSSSIRSPRSPGGARPPRDSTPGTRAAGRDPGQWGAFDATSPSPFPDCRRSG
jgi:hypothetical protein